MRKSSATIYRVAFWTLAVSCVGFAVGSLTKTIALRSGENQKPTLTANRSAAFTIEFKDYAVEASSGKVHEGRFVYAERADGSTVRVNLDDSGKWIMRRIELFAGGKLVVAGDAVGAVSTSYYSPRYIEAYRSKPYDPTCQTHPQVVADQYRIVGTGTFLGMPVIKHIQETAGGSTEMWESPDCNCYPILLRFVWKNPDGSTQSTSDTVATAITLGEPSPLLFEIPTGYTEKPPSAVLADVTRKGSGRELSADRKLERVDERYYESQAYRPKK